jgi:hypothetical protein
MTVEVDLIEELCTELSESHRSYTQKHGIDRGYQFGMPIEELAHTVRAVFERRLNEALRPLTSALTNKDRSNAEG